MGRKSNSLYSFDICDEPTTEEGLLTDINYVALSANSNRARELSESENKLIITV